MKIIEALKEIPLIEKKIDRNAELLQKYSSDIIIGEQGYVFQTEENQKLQVSSLLQSTQDLVKQRAALKRKLAVTNTQVTVTIEGMSMTISEWIEFKNWGINKIHFSFQMLNESNASRQLNLIAADVEKGVRRIRFYDEAEKNKVINFYSELASKVTAQLEIVNATTDLVE